MSIRTDARNDLSAAMQQTLHIDHSVLQSASSANGTMVMAQGGNTANAMDNEQSLAVSNEFHTSNPEHPLSRTVVVNIRASLSDLCLRKQKATWSPPSQEATRAIFQQACPKTRPVSPLNCKLNAPISCLAHCQ